MPRKKSATDRTVDPRGYVLLWRPDHPLADVRGYVYEHRIVAEEKLGRPLRPNEIVHHVNEIKSDNRQNNIEILPSIAHHRARHRGPESKLRLPDETNTVIECICGCGGPFEKYDQVGRPRKFINGHNPQPSPTMDLILGALGSGSKKTAELISLHQSSTAIKVALSKMKRQGLVRSVSHGVWEVA